MNESSSQLSIEGLRSAATSAWREQNQAPFRMLEAFAEVDRRGVHSFGLRALVDLIQLDLHCTRSCARAVVREVEWFASRTSVTGEPLAAKYCLVASALRDGAFSFAHAHVIATALGQLPDQLRATHGARCGYHNNEAPRQGWKPY